MRRIFFCILMLFVSDSAYGLTDVNGDGVIKVCIIGESNSNLPFAWADGYYPEGVTVVSTAVSGSTVVQHSKIGGSSSLIKYCSPYVAGAGCSDAVNYPEERIVHDGVHSWYQDALDTNADMYIVQFIHNDSLALYDKATYPNGTASTITKILQLISDLQTDTGKEVCFVHTFPWRISKDYKTGYGYTSGAYSSATGELPCKTSAECISVSNQNDLATWTALKPQLEALGIKYFDFWEMAENRFGTNTDYHFDLPCTQAGEYGDVIIHPCAYNTWRSFWMPALNYFTGKTVWTTLHGGAEISGGSEIN